MAVTHSCDRCAVPMGSAPDGRLAADLAEGAKTLREIKEAPKLTGPERCIEAELCVTCFLALKDWLAEAPRNFRAPEGENR